MNRAWWALVVLMLSPVLVMGGLTMAAVGYGSSGPLDCPTGVEPPAVVRKPGAQNLSAETMPSPNTPSEDACGPSGDLGPASAFSGLDGYVDDPTSNGRITRRMLNVYNQVNSAFNGWPWGIGCWDRHEWNPSSDHPLGRACDFAVGRLGRFPDAADRATGWRLANWLRANASLLGVKYVIFSGHIWSSARRSEGWRGYDGGGVYDSREATGGHYDHVHVSVS